MKRFVVGEAREQSTLFPALLDDFIANDNPVRAIEPSWTASISEGLVLRVLIRMRQVGQPIIPLYF